jgi:hypothetical protein
METRSTAISLSNAAAAIVAQPLAWVPTDFAESEYVVQLSPEEVVEVEKALDSFKSESGQVIAIFMHRKLWFAQLTPMRTYFRTWSRWG